MGCLIAIPTLFAVVGGIWDAKVGRWTAKASMLFAGSDTNLSGEVLNGPMNLTVCNAEKSVSICANRETFGERLRMA